MNNYIYIHIHTYRNPRVFFHDERPKTCSLRVAFPTTSDRIGTSWFDDRIPGEQKNNLSKW